VYAINNAIDQFRSKPQYAELMREYLTASSSVFMQPIAGRKTYTVKPGDSLSKIAAERLGSADRWREIWDLNRDRVANENLIYPKLVLLMP
jgi:nucleoid-associated protein YgaU